MSKNLSSKYHQENKERLQKKACEKNQNHSQEEKEKKQHYGRKRYQNLSENLKKSLLRIEKNCRMGKNTL